MRNFSIGLSIVSFAFIVFGFLMSFFISDPIFVRSIIFICGLLSTIALFIVSTSLPSCADKIKQQNKTEEFERDVWNRVDALERMVFDDIARVDRRLDGQVSDIHNSIEEVYRSIDSRLIDNCKKNK